MYNLGANFRQRIEFITSLDETKGCNEDSHNIISYIYYILLKS